MLFVMWPQGLSRPKLHDCDMMGNFSDTTVCSLSGKELCTWWPSRVGNTHLYTPTSTWLTPTYCPVISQLRCHFSWEVFLNQDSLAESVVSSHTSRLYVNDRNYYSMSNYIKAILHSSCTCSLIYMLGKESTCNAEHLGSIPVRGRAAGEGNGYPL